MRKKIMIGVDPDLHKSGISVYNSETKTLLDCRTMYMWELFDFIQSAFECDTINTIVYLEAGHMDRRCWHGGGRGASSNTGKGKAVGVIIQEFLDVHKLCYELLKLAGYSDFFKDEKFFRSQTGWNERTNNDARSAAAMVWKR